MPAFPGTRRALTCALSVCAFALTSAFAQNSARSQIGAFGRVTPGERVVAVAVPSYNGAPQVVAELFVKEGDYVSAGQKLARTQSEALANTEVAVAKARLTTISQRLQALQAGPKTEDLAAQEEMIKSLEAEVRVERAKKVPAGTEAKNEAVARDAAANAKVAMSRHQLEAMRAPRPAEVAVAQAEVAEAQAGLDRASALLATTQVCAPSNGQVVKIVTAPGESSAGRPLLEMGDTAAMTVKAEVSVTDIGNVQVGANALLKSEAWPGEFRGEVSRIGLTVEGSSLTTLSPFANVDRHVVEVTIKPETPEKLLGKTGAMVTVLISTVLPTK